MIVRFALGSLLRLGLVLLLGVTSGCGSDDPARHLILITLDTTRADRLGCYGRPDAGTPHLDTLADRGVVFERAYAQVPSTLPSHASILTGSYPPRHGARENGLYRLTSTSRTLAEVLSERGFQTGAVVAARPLDARFGLDQGFGSYEGPGEREFEWPGPQVTRRALRWATTKSESERVFLWAHYFDPHKVYAPPPAFAKQHPDDDYQGEIAATDAFVGELLDGLERQGLLQDAIVAIIADHGESLGQHGESTHSIFLYDATLHVPWILAGPGVPEGARVPELVRSVDLVPTVLELLGVKDPASDQRDGVSLVSRLQGGGRLQLTSYCESMSPRLRYGWCDLIGLRTDRLLYVDAPQRELYYDTEGSAQLNNRIDEASTEDIARWNRSLRSIAFEQLPGGELADTDPAVLEDLRRLGYLEARRDGAEDLESWWETRRKRNDPKERIVTAELLYAGLEALQAGNTPEAVRAFTEATQQDPGNATAWLNLASALQRAREDEEAERALRRAVAADPDFSRAHFQLGLHLLERANALEEAERELLEAIRCDPGFAEPMSRLARLFEQQGRIEEAGRWMERAAEAQPNDADLWRDVARMARGAKDLPAARRAYQKILLLAPGDVEAQRALRTLPPPEKGE